MSETLQRIIGTENELGLSVSPEIQATPERKMEGFAKFMPKGVGVRQGFLTNGGRLYIDINSTLEYCTPECLGVVEAVHAEVAGEELVVSVLNNMVKRGGLDNFLLLRRVVDDGINSWGYHENYLITRDAFDSQDIRPMMMAQLVTRSIFTGAGRWEPSDDSPTRITPAQKAQHVVELEGQDTTKNKVLFNLRDEPFAEKEKWARLHVIVGDANISPWATWLKLGSTSLVARLVEEGLHHSDAVELTSPISALHKVAADDRLKEKFTTSLGQSVCAIDIQEMLVEQCEKMQNKVEIPKDEQVVLAEWRRAVDQMRTDPKQLTDRVDWLARSEFLDHVSDVRGSSYQTLKKYNVAWEHVASGNEKNGLIIGKSVQRHRQDMLFPGFDLDTAKSYIETPPLQTRANLRASTIKEAIRNNTSTNGINWQGLTLDFKYIETLDPYIYDRINS